MKEVNFFLSIICKIIFNDEKYRQVANLSNDDLLSIQMLAGLKDKKEMEIMKEQFIINQKVNPIYNRLACLIRSSKSSRCNLVMINLPERRQEERVICTLGVNDFAYLDYNKFVNENTPVDDKQRLIDEKDIKITKLELPK